MWPRRAAARVRVHLAESDANAPLPSLEGLLLSKRGREFTLAVPHIVFSAEAGPRPLDSKLAVVPRERVAFYEVL